MNVDSSRNPLGYILFEVLFSLALLSIAGMTLQSALRQAILTRGQAEDYTTARFLLNKVISEIELRPQLVEEEKEGTFSSPYERFSYKWKISKLSVPMPQLPSTLPPGMKESLESQFKDYMAKVDLSIIWHRAGMKFEIKTQTLYQPEKLWLPPEERDK
ncbi:MAG: hypothetical protein N3G21_12975 [Candidatus Hydrogenedentes bacterium]|nr:hypothetical protein [Candidatus Hydrogenedentota bacterium]